MLRNLLIFMASLLPSAGVAADLPAPTSCTFTQECVNGDCAESAYELDLTFAESARFFEETTGALERPAVYDVTATDVSQTTFGAVLAPQEGGLLVNLGKASDDESAPLGANTLMIASDGHATYFSALPLDDIALVYFGSCAPTDTDQ